MENATGDGVCFTPPAQDHSCGASTKNQHDPQCGFLYNALDLIIDAVLEVTPHLLQATLDRSTVR